MPDPEVLDEETQQNLQNEELVEEAIAEEMIAEEEPVVPPVDPELEKRAKMMGWVPKEEFRGDITKWTPADQYVKRADELMPIMKTQMRKYEATIGDLQRKVSTQEESIVF